MADNFLRTENPGQGYTYTTYTLGDIIGYDGTVTWNGGRYSNNGTMKIHVLVMIRMDIPIGVFLIWWSCRQ